MLQKLSFFVFFFMFSLTSLAVYNEFTDADMTRVMRHCTNCHDISFLTPRSRKSWELTVYRMREMMPEHGMKKFSKYDADKIIAYLSHHFYEDSEVSVFDFFKNFDYNKLLEDEVVESAEDTAEVKEVVEAVVAAVPLKNAEGIVPPAESGSASVVRTERSQAAVVSQDVKALEARFRMTDKVRQQFSLKMIKTARACGYGSVVLLVVLMGSGLMRRKLKGAFKVVHKLSGLLLLVLLSIHTVIYILKHGHPPVLWYWLGMISLGFVVFTMVVTYTKKRLGKNFIRLHAAAGFAALVLGLLHWLVAYL